MKMKLIVTIALLFTVALSGNAQVQTQPNTDMTGMEMTKSAPAVVSLNEDTIYRRVQVHPRLSFNIHDFLEENLRYPTKAKRYGIHGHVLVEFVVEKDGSITNAKVIKGAELGNGIPEESVRVILAMPKWYPAMQDGQAVRAYFIMPLSFNAP